MNLTCQNPRKLPAVLEVCDPNGVPRLAINDILTCAEKGKAPRGFVYRAPRKYPEDSYIRFVPECVYRHTHYDIDGLEIKLAFLHITDQNLLVYFLHATEYARRENVFYKEISRVFNLLKELEEITPAHIQETTNGLIKRAKSFYKVHLSETPEERIAQRRQLADEISSMTVIEREDKLNPLRFPAIFSIKDPAGFTRPSLTGIVQKQQAGEPIAGFVTNPYDEMHVCPFLRVIPEYALTYRYNLPRLWALIKKYNIHVDNLNSAFLVHASDWGAVDNPCMKELEDLKFKPKIVRPFMYLARQLEKHFQLQAGGKRNQHIIRETRKGRAR